MPRAAALSSAARVGLLELENLEEVVGAGVDDDEVLVSVDGDAARHVDVGSDAVVRDAVDGARRVHVAGAVQQQPAVALVTDDQVGRAVEAQSARLVQLIVAGTAPLAGDPAGPTHGIGGSTGGRVGDNWLDTSGCGTNGENMVAKRQRA